MTGWSDWGIPLPLRDVARGTGRAIRTPIIAPNLRHSEDWDVMQPHVSYVIFGLLPARAVG